MSPELTHSMNFTDDLQYPDIPPAYENEISFDDFAEAEIIPVLVHSSNMESDEQYPTIPPAYALYHEEVEEEILPLLLQYVNTTVVLQ